MISSGTDADSSSEADLPFSPITDSEQEETSDDAMIAVSAGRFAPVSATTTLCDNDTQMDTSR